MYYGDLDPMSLASGSNADLWRQLQQELPSLIQNGEDLSSMDQFDIEQLARMIQTREAKRVRSQIEDIDRQMLKIQSMMNDITRQNMSSVQINEPKPYQISTTPKAEDISNSQIPQQNVEQSPPVNMSTQAAISNDRMQVDNAEATQSNAMSASQQFDTESVVSNVEDRDYKAWKKLIFMAHEDICNHKHGEVFKNPVKTNSKSKYKYSDLVRHPLDLTLIKTKLRDGSITSTDEYLRDVTLMCLNAVMFNPEGSRLREYALEFMEYARLKVKTMVRTEQQWSIKRNNDSRRGSVSSVMSDYK
ncbi:hypothetical protein MIR68_001251 [Amoeboaphelidium protococcarum]|nr:hypothetical protein MIR68_001251 [Amoeboaphelidium protococcarum]